MFLHNNSVCIYILGRLEWHTVIRYINDMEDNSFVILRTFLEISEVRL